MKIKETKEKIIEALEGRSIKKYKLVVEFITDEEFKNAKDVLNGTWLYDNMFSGAISKQELKEIKRIK